MMDFDVDVNSSESSEHEDTIYVEDTHQSTLIEVNNPIFEVKREDLKMDKSIDSDRFRMIESLD